MEITVIELKNRLKAGEKLFIVDVREEWENDEINIPEAVNIPLNSIPERLHDFLNKDEIIIHCKSGNRGNTARAYLLHNGAKNVKNLVGGIEAYYKA